MRFNWHVQQIGNMCIITREDGLIHQVAPRRRLRQQMESHGVVDDIYVALCNQLDSARKATVTAIAMTSKFAPKGPSAALNRQDVDQPSLHPATGTPN